MTVLQARPEIVTEIFLYEEIKQRDKESSTIELKAMASNKTSNIQESS